MKSFACTSHKDPLWHACYWTGAACSTGTNTYKLEPPKRMFEIDPIATPAVTASEQTSQNFGCPASCLRSTDSPNAQRVLSLFLSPTSPHPLSRFSRELPCHSPPIPARATPALPTGGTAPADCSVSHPTLIAQPPPWVCFGPEAPLGFAQSLTSPSLYIAFPFTAISLLLYTRLRQVYA